MKKICERKEVVVTIETASGEILEDPRGYIKHLDQLPEVAQMILIGFCKKKECEPITNIEA